MLMYKFPTIPIKILMSLFFSENKQVDSKFHMEAKAKDLLKN